MTFRIFQDDAMYVIEAPAGSKIVGEGDESPELTLFETLPGGGVVERRLPTTVVIKAARRGFLGLEIREDRDPWTHPEVALSCPLD